MEIFLAMVAVILGTSLSTEKTEIVILDSNKPSAIVVESKDINHTLNTPNSYMAISNVKSSTPKTLPKEEIDQRYGNLIKAGVEPAVSYLLYFVEGDTLDEESMRKIEEIKQTIKRRSPCAISVIGHTDTLGSDKINEEVSLKRAKKVSQMFENENLVDMQILSFGEKDLLVKTSDNVSEHKNRRVEVQVR